MRVGPLGFLRAAVISFSIVLLPICHDDEARQQSAVQRSASLSFLPSASSSLSRFALLFLHRQIYHTLFLSLSLSPSTHSSSSAVSLLIIPLWFSLLRLCENLFLFSFSFCFVLFNVKLAENHRHRFGLCSVSCWHQVSSDFSRRFPLSSLSISPFSPLRTGAE